MRTSAWALATLLLTATTFALASEKKAASQVSIKTNETQIDFLADDNLVGSYYIVNALPRRHFHPVNSPFSKPVTSGYRMGKIIQDNKKCHIRHRGLRLCLGQVIPVGLSLG